MELGAPITHVELTTAVNEPDSSSSEEDLSSSGGDGSSSSNSSSSSDDESSFKVINAGQVVVPGFYPEITNNVAYFHPELIRSKNTEYDDKALTVAQTIANVTLACLTKSCTLLKTGISTDLDPFLH